jgi:hypothetical protein
MRCCATRQGAEHAARELQYGQYELAIPRRTQSGGLAFDGLTVSPCCETMSLQIGLVGRGRFLIPFEANAKHIGNVKQSVTNFIWLL